MTIAFKPASKARDRAKPRSLPGSAGQLDPVEAEEPDPDLDPNSDFGQPVDPASALWNRDEQTSVRPGHFRTTDIPGQSISIASGCLTKTVRSKRKLESKKAAAARSRGEGKGKAAKRRMTVYRYVEIQFHWSEKLQGQWRSRSCYVGGYPAGQKPKANSRTAQRIAIIEQQIENERPYGETLEKLGLGQQLTKHQKR